MAKKKTTTKKPSTKPRAPRPSKPEVEEFMEIGGSPMPGITLRHVLRGHTAKINRIAWSPDGRYLASPSEDRTIRIWNVEHEKCINILKPNMDIVVTCVEWSSDGQRIAFGGLGGDLGIWESKNNQMTKLANHSLGIVRSIKWSPDDRVIAIGNEGNEISLWETFKWERLKSLKSKEITGYCLAWSKDSDYIASSGNRITQIWDTRTGKVLNSFVGHNNSVFSILLINDELVSGSADRTIRFWDIKTGKQKDKLEGHTENIYTLSCSANKRILASKAFDSSIILWDYSNRIKLGEIPENGKGGFLPGISFHPTRDSFLATLGGKDKIIRIWDIDYDVLIKNAPTNESVRYTTAKLVLVGDSGVGKTGLGWRLAHNEFKEHSSTHGQQFWVVPELKKTRDDGTECEAVLWDLAGQHIYRSIHSIFLDDVDASLVLFDPTNRQEPLKGAQFWLAQLKGKKELPPSVLVGARLDRGTPVLSQQELDQFCQKYAIRGGYIGTSAKSGEGMDKLLESLKAQIPWDQKTTTVTTVTFKKIKEYVLSLKENTRRKKVLVSPAELRKKVETTDKSWKFTDDEMMTAVGHLENHGYVSILRSSSGEKFILLVPELLVSLASSIFLQADRHPRELGAINESELLQGKLQFTELEKLTKKEQLVLLDVAVVKFLEHSVCFREKLGNENLLIFPSLIKQKRPLQDEISATDDISFLVRGRVENIYAMLVVLLGYTQSFTRINQWQNQAQYEMGKNEICGFRMIEEREGEIELVLYYGDKMPQSGRKSFQELFEQFLYQRDVEVTRFPPVICENGHRQERAIVMSRIREKKSFAFCAECGKEVKLPEIDKSSIGTSASPWLQQEEAIARLRNTYETHLARVKGYRRERQIPRCYISKVSVQKDWADNLIHDLSDAGVYVIEDASKVDDEDTVIVLDSPTYQKAWKTKSLEQDAKLIQTRLSSKKLISIAVQGKSTNQHDVHGCEPGDFCDETHYPVSLFDLILNLYAIPLNHVGFAPLRQSLHEQWEQSLAGKKGKDMTSPLKVFISYSHKDEEFKDELVTMLASLQRRGIVDAWQDRRIEEGDEWYQKIQDAMNDSDLAILLVSANFLASRFIQDEELPKLFKRRIEGGMRVVPIIVKQCMWQSEPVIKDIQVMPRDGKPVITFSKDNGDRDQVWTDIAKAIEKRAK